MTDGREGRRPVWVLRDLSNGDGADGRAMPTYVWAFDTRAEARKQRMAHQRNRKLARLGPVEKWLRTRLMDYYEDVGGIAAGHYWRRTR